MVNASEGSYLRPIWLSTLFYPSLYRTIKKRKEIWPEPFRLYPRRGAARLDSDLIASWSVWQRASAIDSGVSCRTSLSHDFPNSFFCELWPFHFRRITRQIKSYII